MQNVSANVRERSNHSLCFHRLTQIYERLLEHRAQNQGNPKSFSYTQIYTIPYWVLAMVEGDTHRNIQRTEIMLFKHEYNVRSTVMYSAKINSFLESMYCLMALQNS